MTDTQYHGIVTVIALVGIINLAVTTANSLIIQRAIRRKGK